MSLLNTLPKLRHPAAAQNIEAAPPYELPPMTADVEVQPIYWPAAQAAAAAVRQQGPQIIESATGVGHQDAWQQANELAKKLEDTIQPSIYAQEVLRDDSFGKNQQSDDSLRRIIPTQTLAKDGESQPRPEKEFRAEEDAVRKAQSEALWTHSLKGQEASFVLRSLDAVVKAEQAKTRPQPHKRSRATTLSIGAKALSMLKGISADDKRIALQ